MRLVHQLWNSLTDFSIVEHNPLIVIYKNKRIIIEDIEQLLSFNHHEILIKSRLGKIEVYGEQLFITFMRQNEIALEGVITKIYFSQEEGGNV